MSKCIIILGPPGSGKSTQGKKLAQSIVGAHFISVGALLREASHSNDIAGIAIKNIIKNGGTVTSDLLIPVLGKAISQNRNADLLIIDFAGTVEQSKLLDNILATHGYTDIIAILLKVPLPILRKRLIVREREDDKTDLVSIRFLIYQEEILPVCKYYQDKGSLQVVNGNSSPEIITNKIIGLLHKS
jgi:adenylate kinase